MWKRWDSEWDELETVVEEVIDAGDKVLMAVRYRGRGRVSGVEVNDLQFEVHTFRTAGACTRWTSECGPKPSKPPGCRSRRSLPSQVLGPDRGGDVVSAPPPL